MNNTCKIVRKTQSLKKWIVIHCIGRLSNSVNPIPTDVV